MVFNCQHTQDVKVLKINVGRDGFQRFRVEGLRLKGEWKGDVFLFLIILISTEIIGLNFFLGFSFHVLILYFFNVLLAWLLYSLIRFDNKSLNN